MFVIIGTIESKCSFNIPVRIIPVNILLRTCIPTYLHTSANPSVHLTYQCEFKCSFNIPVNILLRTCIPTYSFMILLNKSLSVDISSTPLIT